MFRTVPLSIIRNYPLYKKQWNMSQVCLRAESGRNFCSVLILFTSCQKSCMTYHCCVYSEKFLMMGQRNCPKHGEFYSKNKFEKLVGLFGFIIRIYLETFVREPYNIDASMSHVFKNKIKLSKIKLNLLS